MERTKNFTDAEFKALPRNDDNDVIDLYGAFVWMTPKQVDALTVTISHAWTTMKKN